MLSHCGQCFNIARTFSGYSPNNLLSVFISYFLSHDDKSVPFQRFPFLDIARKEDTVGTIELMEHADHLCVISIVHAIKADSPVSFEGITSARAFHFHSQNLIPEACSATFLSLGIDKHPPAADDYGTQSIGELLLTVTFLRIECFREQAGRLQAHHRNTVCQITCAQ